MSLRPLFILLFVLSTAAAGAQRPAHHALRLGGTLTLVHGRYYDGWGGYYGYNLNYEQHMGAHWTFSPTFSLSKGRSYWGTQAIFAAAKYTVQPQFRFYPMASLHGFFVGAHLELTYFDGVVRSDAGFGWPLDYLNEIGGGLGAGYVWLFDPQLDLSFNGSCTAYPFDEETHFAGELQLGYRF